MMQPAARSSSDTLRGAVLLAIAGLLLTIEVVLVRFAAVEATQAQIVFARAAAQFTTVLCWIAWRGGF